MLFAGLSVLVALVLFGGGLAAVLAMRGNERDTPATDGDAGDGTVPLLVPGQRVIVERGVQLPSIGGPDCAGVALIIKVRSVSIEASGRVVVAYSIDVPRVAEVQDCLLRHAPDDAGCACVMLETRHSSGAVTRAWNTGGSGVAVQGAPDLYGVGPIEGEWWFDDGVDLTGEDLTLRRENFSGYRYDILLVSR